MVSRIVSLILFMRAAATAAVTRFYPVPYNRPLLMDRIEKGLVVALPPLLCAGAAVTLGLDANWDLRNYHYYNAYAFLNGRLGLDVAPGQLQTFHNPLPDLPFYWLAQSWPPLWISAAWGALHGLNLTLLWLIFGEATERPMPRYRWAAGVVVLWLGWRGPAFLAELGNTMNDNLVSLFVLASVMLLLVASRRPAGAQRTVMLAGAIMGAGFGLKPTLLPYVLSSGIALIWLWPTSQTRRQALLAFAAAGAAGTVATAGAWSWQLWTAFGNPTFPYRIRSSTRLTPRLCRSLTPDSCPTQSGSTARGPWSSRPILYGSRSSRSEMFVLPFSMGWPSRPLSRSSAAARKSRSRIASDGGIRPVS
jgi:hypothetical protein